MSTENITLPKSSFVSLMSQTVDVLKDVGPRLEKLASLENQQAQFAKQAAERLVAAGVIKASDIQTAEKELNEGFDKIASMLDFVINSTQTVKPMGKSAEASTRSVEKLTADDVFNRKLGL